MLKNHNISSWDRTVNRMFIFTHNIIASAIKVNHIPNNIPLQLCLFLQFLPILKIIFIHLLPLYFSWKISLSFTIITSLPLLLDDTCFIRHFILRINIIIHFFNLTKVQSQTRVKLQVQSGLVGSGTVNEDTVELTYDERSCCNNCCYLLIWSYVITDLLHSYLVNLKNSYHWAYSISTEVIIFI
jgi:hypothetical protein